MIFLGADAIAPSSGLKGTKANFVSVQDLVSFFGGLQEEVQRAESESWLDPDYTVFYQKIFGRSSASSLINWLFAWSNKQAGVLDQDDILQSIARFNQRPYQKLQKEGDLSVQILTMEEQDTVFIFGDLHGAFHSFLRTLQRFVAEGIIDDSMHIKDPKTYLVFLGDYLNRSPYGFHLLTVLLHLAAQNPGQVLLLRGRQETNRYWENFLASRVFLKMMFNIKDEAELPLAVELNNVFERLPEALLLKHKNTGEIVVCAHNVIPPKTRREPETIAFLCGEDRRGIWLNSGLVFQEFLAGTALWRLFSAPVPLYMRYGGLDRDSVCCVPIGKSFAHSLLECWYATRPTLQEGSFSAKSIWEKEVFSLAYGHQIEREQDQMILAHSRPYFLCSSGDLSATLRRTTRGSKQGVEACFLDANQQGGVENYLFRVVFLDDEYTPMKMAENVRLLRERYGADALLVPQGSAPIQELMPQIQRGDFFVFFPYTGSAAFRKPEIVSMIHARQPYFNELERLLRHFQAKYTSKKFALIYQNDAFGSPIAHHAKEYLEKNYPGSIVELIPFARGQLSMEQQLRQLKKHNPESIGFFITNPAQISTIITDLGINTFVGRHIFAIAFEEFFVEVAARWGVSAMFSSSFQPPRFRQGALMEEFCALMKKYHFSLNIPAYEAFFASKLFLTGMRQAESPITSQKILTAIERISGTEFYGQKMSFDPNIRGFVLPVWVFEEDGTVSRLE
ncbi:TPA: hypothetical protein DCW54_00990 [Candidatus Dependentiae bacterium]|nr:hypothetical protein [Candidatus Dependentiae bacterium]